MLKQSGDATGRRAAAISVLQLPPLSSPRPCCSQFTELELCGTVPLLSPHSQAPQSKKDLKSPALVLGLTAYVLSFLKQGGSRSLACIIRRAYLITTASGLSSLSKSGEGCPHKWVLHKDRK